MIWLAIILAIIATLIGAFGSLVWKKGADPNKSIIRMLFSWMIIFGAVLFVLSSVFYVWALKLDNLSIIYPLTSLSYIWVVFLSVKFLKERMNSYKWIGILLILVGVVLISI